MLSQLLEICHRLLHYFHRPSRDISLARRQRSTLDLGHVTNSTGHSLEVLAFIFHSMSGQRSRARLCPVTIRATRQRQG